MLVNTQAQTASLRPWTILAYKLQCYSPDVVVVVVVVVVTTSVMCSVSPAFVVVVVVIVVIVVTVLTVSAVSYKQEGTVSNTGLLCTAPLSGWNEFGSDGCHLSLKMEAECSSETVKHTT